MNYWIWFSIIKGLGPIKKMMLLNKFKTVENIYYAKKNELQEVGGVTDDIIRNIEESKNLELIDKYEEYLNKNNIKLINIYDEEYPKKLLEIYAPPITLFAKGNINLLNEKSIGIVGCREASYYGMQIAQKFAFELAKSKITIVSGMAKGIDAASHVRCYCFKW